MAGCDVTQPRAVQQSSRWRGCLVLSSWLVEGGLGIASCSGLVLLGVGRDVLQGSLDGLRDGVRGGQMGSLWYESVLVSSVLDADPGAIRGGISVSALSYLGLLLRVTQILHESFFLSLDLIAGFVAAT